jgi:hypothetical protein
MVHDTPTIVNGTSYPTIMNSREMDSLCKIYVNRATNRANRMSIPNTSTGVKVTTATIATNMHSYSQLILLGEKCQKLEQERKTCYGRARALRRTLARAIWYSTARTEPWPYYTSHASDKVSLHKVIPLYSIKIKLDLFEG